MSRDLPLSGSVLLDELFHLVRYNGGTYLIRLLCGLQNSNNVHCLSQSKQHVWEIESLASVLHLAQNPCPGLGLLVGEVNFLTSSLPLGLAM